MPPSNSSAFRARKINISAAALIRVNIVSLMRCLILYLLILLLIPPPTEEFYPFVVLTTLFFLLRFDFLRFLSFVDGGLVSPRF